MRRSGKNDMTIPILTKGDVAGRQEEMRRPWHENYLAMYSSIWDGIVTDPVLMTVPVDDHLVHRADGVFDLFKVLGGKAYCMRAHLERLEKSAAALDLDLPDQFEGIEDILRAAAQAGGRPDVAIRIIVSRGPGGFSTNPFECPASQLYIIVVGLKILPPEVYETGVSIISAPPAVKLSPFAGVKSCNYLTNVMIKKAAIKAGVEFAVTWDHEGFLAEGSVENIMLVSPGGELLVPGFDRVLQGITVTRIMALAERLIDEGLLKGIRTARIDRDLAGRAPEVMLSGTTLNVLPVTEWDGRKVGDGRPGPVARRLKELLHWDMTQNEELLTPLM